MTIDEQIAILEAYKAGKRINFESIMFSGSGVFDKNSIGHDRFDFQHITYSIAHSFIIVNGVQVPEPVRVMPEYRTKYYFPSLHGDREVESCNVGSLCGGDSFDNRLMGRGLMHLTEAAAREHYEALILPSKQK